MQVQVKWIDGVSFVGESETGHAVVLDGAPENGGRNIGMRPMEMLLIGMGACTAFDVVTILKKSRQPITDCVAQITADRADEIPKVFTKIHFHFIQNGNDIDACATRQGSQHEAFGAWPTVFSPIVGRGVHYYFVTVDIGGESHAFDETGAYRVCCHNC